MECARQTDNSNWNCGIFRSLDVSRFALYLVAAIASTAMPLRAQSWSEVGDAPPVVPPVPPVGSGIPGQIPIGSGPFTMINGTINNPDFDVDIYCIQIVDPIAFQAQVFPMGTLDSVSLFLFDNNGFGLSHHSGPTPPPPNGYAPNVNATTSGQHWLAVAHAGIHPVSATGQMWNPSVPGPMNQYAPNGPGAGSPVTSWPGLGFGGPGPYRVILTGTEFCGGCPQPVVQIVYDGGRDENCNFTAPNDPAKRSACLTSAYPTGAWKDFDDATANRFVGHTFGSLPTGIIAATLEICMRPHSDIPNNDSINLCLNQCSPATFAWGEFIRDLPGNGGTWTNGEPCQCFLLDLANLPNVSGPPSNILPCLNSRCGLDMFIQDDTAVDFAQLTVTVCPCSNSPQTFVAGLNDCLALPTEPSARCQGVTDLRTTAPFLWKNFDDPQIDRGVGETFTNLPPGIVAAQFQIGMQSIGGGNDGISLDLKECACYPMSGGPPQFAWGSPIGSLTGAPYCGGPAPLVYTMDLATLVPVNGYNPAIPGILGAMADGTLDVYVQDDHNVDFMNLQVRTCPCCEPLAGVFGCTNTVCPNPALQKCIPIAAYCDAAGVCVVTECDCRDANQCHLDFTAPAQPFCTGACPIPGLICRVIDTPDAVGGHAYRCDCQEMPEACCLQNGMCITTLAGDCQSQGGTPLGAGSSCQGVEACCYLAADGTLACQDVDVACCKQIFGGTPQGSGTTCQGDNNGNGIDDECEPPGCQPPPPGAIDCPPVVCPVAGDKCQPKCVDYDPNTGSFTIAECDCRDSGGCHAEFVVGSPDPFCVGPCPQGEACVTTTTPLGTCAGSGASCTGTGQGTCPVGDTCNPTGATRTCCNCEQVSDQCDALADQSACNQFICPAPPPNHECRPRCLRFDPATGQTLYIDCDCRHVNECYAVPSTLVPPLEPRCVGLCPPGDTCVETRTVDPLTGVVDICCDCGHRCPVQNPANPNDPCASLQATECVDGGPNDSCLALCVEIVQGPTGNETRATECACTVPGPCGPVSVIPIPGSNDYALECHGGCPAPEVGYCQTILNGVPQGLPLSLVLSLLSPGDVVCCDCVEDPPPPVCPTPMPPAVDICGPLQQQQCRDGLANDLCFPTAVLWNPMNGSSTALNCECMPDTKCHVNPGGAGVPPSCVGACPTTGDQCMPTQIPNGDGTFDFSCDCCQDGTVSINLNTGWYDSGGLIPYNQPDDTWTVQCEPPQNPPVGPIPRPATVIVPNSAWLTQPNSRWISADATGPNGTYCYQYCFCLADTYTNASLTFQFRADDRADLYFNGNLLISTPPSYSFNSPIPTGLSTIGYFQAGENCIDVIVENTHGVVTGFNLTGQVYADNAQCCCEPEPNGLACSKTTCPNSSDRCKPTELVYDPATGQTRVTKCDCVNPDECYLELEEPGVYFCAGLVCPGTGTTCHHTATANANGTVTHECCAPPLGCGPCRLYTDLEPFFCLIDIGDVLKVLDAYAEPVVCTTMSTAGITPGSLAYGAGGCSLECTVDADCAEGGSCVNGLCCDFTDITEVLAVLDAFASASTCPHRCPPGACELGVPISCCRDGSYFPDGTSESDCLSLGGTYLGDNTTCAGSLLPPCP